ncbi:MAG TPA: hypothetical protein VD794_00530, partial [Flavisolibacter sp.]|nr:hypothetical protein [Flavisolibacter sp.]
ICIFTFAIDQPKKTIAQQPAVQNTQNSPASTTQSTPETGSTTITNNGAVNSNTMQDNSTISQGNLANTLTSTTTKRYKVVAKEDGKLVRLSQKAFAVFDCAVKATANKNIRCKENIESMQEKMATSVISPTGDFAGLIDMIKTLEENN